MRYYQDVVNLLFWVLWVCLATYNNYYNYQPVESFPVCKHAKNQLHAARFHGDIAKIYKLLASGTLGMPA